jgi:phytoene desaturase
VVNFGQGEADDMAVRAEDKHVVVVGAGPGGLTAAMILAKRGLRVTVLEARDTVGGRNGAIRLGPYTFDIGPTFLMLREILDQVFHEAGAATDQLLDVRRLEPMYRLQFDDRALEPSTDHEVMKREIARCFPGQQHRYDAFFQREQKRFEMMFPCLQKSYHRAGTLFSPDLWRAIPHLALGRSLYDVMAGYFSDEKLALSFTFQSKYLGMSPWKCPGLFSIIPYIEHAFGIEHPIGGLSRISDAMADVARGHGADIRLATPVERVLVEDRTVKGVRLAGGETITADDVVLNADFGYAATHLFEPGVLRKYSPDRVARMKFSCSTFMMYLGVDKRYDMPHHTIVFARDYRDNVGRIFDGQDLTDDISFYVRCADATDPTLAPEGHSAIYVLVPTPNLRGGIDWDRRRAELREMTLNAIEARTEMKDLRQHIREELIIAPPDWQDTYNVYAGATFNLAHNLGQMIYARPRNKFEEVDHCYLVGGGTHPGSGLPTIYESGRISANLLCRSYGIAFTSGNLEV